MKILGQLLDVSSTDPNDARRRKLLNILLAGLLTVTGLAVVFVAIYNVLGIGERLFQLFWGSLFTMLGVTAIWAVNRFWSGEVASILFLTLLTAVFALTDEPEQVVNGRTLLMFVMPISMASVLLRPWASFILATIISILVGGMALYVGFAPNVTAMLGFQVIALVSWLATRSLEKALEDLRAINRELDHRVATRTQELAQALSENQAILESIADGVVVFDNDQTAVVANPAVATLLGHASDQITETNVESLLTRHVNESDREVINDAFQDRHKRYDNVKFQWGKKTLSMSLAPVRDALGQVTGTVSVFRDFTREAELDRMKSAFVSIVSHELRTPLNAVLGYAEMLKENVYGPINNKQKEVMKRIMANATRQLSLVNDLLDQAQIEAGTLSLQLVPVAPQDLVSDMMATMTVLAESKGLELEAHIDKHVPQVIIGDRQRLHQILVNLVNNALKFTEQGGVQVYLYRPNDEHWGIKVIDTGPGIPPEAQTYIFEPFRRVDSSITRRHKGAGLGLSIVKQLTTLMGGTISLQSNLGEGSTFTVILPLEPGEQHHKVSN